VTDTAYALLFLKKATLRVFTKDSTKKE